MATKILAIVGPTASGKSELAMELAEKFNGEIICADSRTVYAGMDIGTAKPSKADRARVPHHLLDVVKPGQKFTVADFKYLAEKAIEDIESRGKLPIVVGGSGLYISVLLYDFQLSPPADEAFRQQLERLTTPQLLDKLEDADPDAAAMIDTKNRRRVIRAIETAGLPKVKLSTLRPNCLLIGLELNKEVLQDRVADRVEAMLDAGFVDEVKQIGRQYGWDSEAMTGIGYRAFRDVVVGGKSIETAKDEFIKGDMSLAKKQMTWFKRDPNITWIESSPQAVDMVADFLS